SSSRARKASTSSRRKSLFLNGVKVGEVVETIRSYDFLLEEVDAFLALEDDPTSPEVDQSYVNTKGDILLLEAFLNDDPSLPPPNQGNYLPQVELKDLPPHLEYAFLESDDKLPVIIAKDLSVEEKTALITVLKSHKRAIAWKLFDIKILSVEEKTALIMVPKSYKRAIAWKLSDIKGIDPKFYTHKILMEEDFEPAVQHQRRVNPKIHDVIKNEVLKLLDAGLIYPIFDSAWEKSHFMVKEGIVLGHKISKNKIKVDKAKVDVIAKLPHPTTVKAGENVKQDAIVAKKEVSNDDPVTTTGDVVTTARGVEAKPRERGVIIQEPSKFRTTSSSQPSQLPQAKDKGKRIMVEPEKPLKKKDQNALDEEVARKFKAQMKVEIEEEEKIVEERLKKTQAEVTEGSSKRAGDEIHQESAKRQRLEKEDDTVEIKRCLKIVPVGILDLMIQSE
nr:reverse transcriptase domain-containing protein [Tanacetum cinerariifolium]